MIDNPTSKDKVKNRIQSPPKNFDELIRRLEEIKQTGYVKTHRTGPTGIGKTLEDLLGIIENNVPGPNAVMLELKSARKGSSNMITLITKAPLPRGANSLLLKRFGYPVPPFGREALHITLRQPPLWTTIRGKPAIKLNLKNDTIQLVSIEGETLGFWTEKVLEEAFKKKFPGLVYVKADCRGEGANEYFWFNEAWLLKGFDFEAIKKLIQDFVIRIDIRIGQYPNGRPHDHGTAFRIFEDGLDRCFKERKNLFKR
ncbi:MAG: MvaI/BcnI family restriction endonuclease [Candidatus Caldarchaeum sp.]